jgi:uncharacterized repeat protein (TIGR02543 family)
MYAMVGSMLMLSTIVSGVGGHVAAFAGGDGSPGTPYQVASWSDLYDVRNNLAASYILTVDLDQNSDGYETYAGSSANASNGWLPIGDSSTRFQGTFNGNSHTIADLHINRSSTGYIGLFGATNGSAIISNLTLVNPIISGGGQTGGIVGQNQGTISEVHVDNPSIIAASSAGGVVGQNSNGTITLSSTRDGTVISMAAWGGGLVGLLNGGTIARSWSSADVSANNDAGGLAGHSGNGSIQNSYSTGNVTSYNASSENSFGGMAGVAGNITNAYATGNVTIAGTGPNSGGLYGEGGAVMNNTFATGSVSGTAPIGGYAGLNSSNNSNSYSVYGAPVGSGNTNGVSDVSDATVFMGADHTHAVYADWDFETIWEAHNNALPTLRGNVEQEVTYIITFDTQGGSAVESMIGLSQGDGVMLPAAPTRSGYIFVAWNTAADGSGTARDPNAEYVVPANDMTFYAIWQLEEVSTSDNDGISDVLEDAGPNGGDGNNDGTPDSEQGNVSSFVSPVTDNYVTLEVDNTCNLSNVSGTSEGGLAVQDIAYTYTSGLVNFTATGCAGGTTTVNLYYAGVNPSDMVLRKYNPVSNTYATVTSAILTNASAPLMGTRVTYTLIDNGSLDTNPTAGVIDDPVGLASIIPGAPNTGFGPVRTATAYTLFIVSGIVTIIVATRRFAVQLRR